jgi:cobaltochelatase CobN
MLAETIQQHTQLDAQAFVKHLTVNINSISKQLAADRGKEQQLAESVSLFKTSLSSVVSYRDHLLSGASDEFNAMNNGLAGGYIEPSSGGDPILNASALPTGRNMYAIDAEKTPSVAAWNIGKQLADTLLATHFEKNGKYPEKVSFTLWPSEFIHTQGATVAQILYLLGVEPVRDPFKRVKNLKLIPDDELGRPRIDIVVQSAGQLRDLAASRLALIERAVKMVADAEEGEQINFVAKGVRDAEKYLLDKGVAPLTARTNAYRRSFGGVNGAYGTAIMSQVEQGESWESDSDIAQQYIYNMGAAYGDSDSWSEFTPHLFAAALQNTEVVIQPRSSNTWGALSLDHVYEFMGGLNLAVREVTGKDPAAYFNDYRNPNKAKLETLNQTLWMELRSTLLNPKYITDLMAGEASSAETFAETFRNTYGWNVMKPDAIDDSVWNNLHQVYVEDSHELNVREFFEQENPYALQEMTGVMLETARKGLWKASKEQLLTLATLHTELVIKHEAGCGNFTCGNQSLQAFVKAQLTDAALTQAYQQQINAAEIGKSQSSGLVLSKQTEKAEQSKQSKQSQQTNEVKSGKESHQTESTSKENNEMSEDSNKFAWLWLLLLIPLSILLIRRKKRVR